jgi:acyl-lipid omega-6 desaturase (Delta-12 desaturase)
MDQTATSTLSAPANRAQASAAPDIDNGAQTPGARPNVPEVRGQVPAEVRTQSLPHGLWSFTVAGGLYALTLWGALAAPWWPLQLLCGIVNGLFIAMFFVVGHDACHGGLTPFEALNQTLGRIAFLPSLTPYITWEFAHNRIHHSYTNWRVKDYAWAPYSKDEYDRMSGLRRLMERHYRSILGLGSYYLIEYWWKHLLFPSKAEREEMKQPKTYVFDVLLVIAFLVAEVAFVLWWASTTVPSEGWLGAFTSPAALIIVALVVPFLMWNWFMSFAIFQHHNHPRVAWFIDRDEWDFFAGQVESTVHVVMPWYLEFVTAHIMQHTAHHVDPKIPLYRLTDSQHCLEEAYPQDIVVERWTFTTLGRTLVRCQLYDYENHRWLNFRGRPTSEPNPVLRALREGNAPPRRKKSASVEA